MSIIESLEKRRSIYKINDSLPVSETQVIEAVQKAVAIIPESMNTKCQQAIVAFGGRHRELWNGLNAATGGKGGEKIEDALKGAGSVVFGVNQDGVKGLQDKFAAFAQVFPVFATESSGMLQLAVWTALRDLGIGASLQHQILMAPKLAHELFGVPESFKAMSVMPFGGIVQEREPREAPDVSKLVIVAR